MRVLFFMRSTVYARNFESTLRLLAERGHRIHVAANTDLHRLDHADLIGRLSREYPNITSGPQPQPLATQWSRRGHELRRGVDYLRYWGPEYRSAPKLRWRAAQKAPAFLTTPAAQRLCRYSMARRALVVLMRAADRAVPLDPAIEAFVREQAPDLVVVTPLVEPGSPQSTYVRAAQALGIRTALCVYSWDNLTNKGLIHDTLDAVTVWNEAMREEAVTLHGMPAERVVVTGAAAHDHWFRWKPRDTKEAFCDRVGLDARRPYLLYVCSSKFIAPDEVSFVRRWITEIRGASNVLNDVGVLVRPHPQNMTPWRQADFGDFVNVAVWPRADGNPVDDESRAQYFDSMFHSVGVVGVNTSAQIESAIVGRAVHTWLTSEFRDTQDGTLHFGHLRRADGGVLRVASDIREHVEHLEAAVRDPHAARERCRQFVASFVRPQGIDEAATPRLVAALEATAALGAQRPRVAPWWAPMVRPAIVRLARP